MSFGKCLSLSEPVPAPVKWGWHQQLTRRVAVKIRGNASVSVWVFQRLTLRPELCCRPCVREVIPGTSPVQVDESQERDQGR